MVECVFLKESIMNIVTIEEYTSKKDSFHRMFLQEHKRIAGIALITPAVRKKIDSMFYSDAVKLLTAEIVFKIKHTTAGYWDESIVEFEDVPPTAHHILLHNVKSGEVFPIDCNVHHYDLWPELISKVKGKWVVNGIKPLKRRSESDLARITEEIQRIRDVLGGKPKIRIKLSRKGSTDLNIRIDSKL